MSGIEDSRLDELAESISDTDQRVDELTIRVSVIERSIKASALMATRKKEASDVSGYGR
jgi:hypothetical protein